MLLCSFLLASVGWAMAQNEDPESSGSTTRYVKGDYTGNDSDGTETKPYRTVEDAITAMTSGGTIIISPSKTAYTLPKSITQSFTFQGNSGENEDRPSINLENTSYPTNGGTNVELAFEKITLKRSGKDTFAGFPHSHKETYTNCDISGEYWTYAPEVLFSHCTFQQETDGLYMARLYGPGHISFDHCSFQGASGKAILIYNEGHGNSNEFHVSVNNCTFDAKAIKYGKTAIQMHTELGTHGSLNITESKATGFDPSINVGLWNCLNNGSNTPTDAFAVTVDGIVVNGINRAIEYAAEGSTIKLAAGDFVLSKPLVITKAITLIGDVDKTVIKAVANKESFTPVNGKDYNLVTITGAGTGSVKLENLRITESHGSGLNVQTAMKTYLDKVQLYDNENAGLLVHSEVEAQFLETEENGWGGVNIDKGTPEYTRKLTIKSNGYNFREKVKIWAEKANCPDPYETVSIQEQDSHLTYKWAVVEGKGGEKWDTDMIYWVTTDKPKNDSNYTTIFVSDYSTVKDSKGHPYYNANFYADGNPVKVEAVDEHYTKIVNGNSDKDYIILPYQNRATLYGGAKNATVNSTSITMTGGQLARIYGGGYASSDGVVANVNTATINITGGEISDALTLGGVRRSKVTSATVTVTGSSEDAKIKVNTFVVGGFASPGTDNRVNTWETANCGVQNATIALKNVDIKYMGAGGGQGYSYTGSTNVSVENATINSAYGTLYNGYADNIEASFKNVKFSGEFATINRGAVGSANFTFDGCTLNANAINCIGAATGWAGSDTDGSDAPEVSGPVTYTFTNMSTVPTIYVGEGLTNANVTVTGAPVKIAKFDKGTGTNMVDGFEQYLTAFTIGEGKTWTFNKGYEIAEGASLTRTGKLIVGVDTEAALQEAVALDADTIKLAAKDFALTKQLTMNKSVALVGTTVGEKTSTIKYGAFTGGTDRDSKHMISVLADNVLLQNLVVDGTGHATENNSGSAIHVYKAKSVVLDNVIARNAIAAGLIVNGSTVTATNFHTEGNGWYGVNVDKGDGVEGTPVFTIGNNCSFAETTAIKADSQNAASSWVVGDGWVMVSKTENGKTFKIWQNAAAQGINYAIISVPATVVYGEANLPLLSNITPAEGKLITFAVTEGEEYVKIVNDDSDNTKKMLQILKPGKATLSLEYDGVTVTQAVEVLKRTITVSGITATEKTYDGTTSVALNSGQVKVEGYISETEGVSLFTGYTGTLSSANAGDAVPVTISATPNVTDLEKYYEVVYAPVTAKVNKKNLTVTTEAISSPISFGDDLPTFTAKYGLDDVEQNDGFVDGETKDVLSGTLQFDCPATSSSLAGTYTVTPYGLTSNNYAIKYQGTTLKINAIAPSVEIVSATVSNDKSTVTVKGHVTNNGGTKTTELTGGFQVGEDVKASDLKVDENGYFTADLTDLSKAEINLKATATATIPESQSLKGTSTTDFKVDLALNPQNVSFVTNLSRLVYGSKVTLDAAGYAEGATVTYSVEGKALKLDKTDGKTITAAETGTATITVTAKLEGYITATAKQTVVVEPKSVTINPFKNTLTKAYDGELEIPVEYSLVGLLESDQAVMPNNDNVKFMFLDKNVGTNKPIVTTGPLKLRGTNAEYYTMVQPTNLTGTITPGDKVTVEVSNVHRKYNESALHYSLNFTANGKRIDPIYTGSITVTENRSNGTWTASLNSVKFPNYGEVSLASKEGPVNIEKGTPKVLTYTSAANTVSGLLVDAEGWTTSVIEIKNDGVKQYAQVTYDNGKIARGVSLDVPSAITPHTWNITKNSMRAAALRAAETSTQLDYGQTATLTKVDGFAYSVSNPAVITLTENSGNYTINAVGVGDAAVIADNGSTVVYHRIKVTPKTLNINVSSADKTYDGTTVANPSLAISGTAPAGVALDLTGIRFNYASANADDNVTIHPTQPIALTGANAANYKVGSISINGTIYARELTVTSPISKYYDGSKTLTLTDYNATGLLVGEAAPAITVTFANANVGTDKTLTWPTSLANSNYTLAGKPDKGNIVRSTIDAVLPENGVPSKEALKQSVALTVRETGATVNWNTIDYNPTITTTGSGTSTIYYISGGDTENYAVVYSSNQIGYGAAPVIPGGGGGGSSEPETPETPTTPGTPTGVESISEGSQLYTVKGAVVVSPAEPLQVAIYSVTGQTLFNDEVSYLTQVPAKAGIYVVVIQKGNDRITEKVFVK